MRELAIDVDRAGDRSLTAQIVEGIRAAVLAGELAAGDALPSSRALARTLGVSRGVVVSAVDQLSGEGYLEVSQGAAARVAPVDRTDGAQRPANVPEPAASVPRINLLPGFPSTARLDERAWRSAWRRAASGAVPSGEAEDLGTRPLREQIAEHVRQARGVSCTASDIVVTAGTSEAVMLMTLVLRALHPRGVRVAVEDPGYPASRGALLRFGAAVVPLPVNDDGIEVSALAAIDPAPHAVLLTPSHQYPLGGRLPVAARLEVLAWASRTDALVIEDDYDSEFRHGAATLPALASLDRDERVVLVGSFSKVLTPWIRLGYLVLPRRPELHAALRAIRADATCPVPGIAQDAIALLLEGGAVRRHIAAVRRDYAHRRLLVIRMLGDLPAATLAGLEGGLHAVVQLATSAAAEQVRATATAAGVAVAELRDYAADPDGPHRPGIVFGYAAPGDTALSEGLTVLRAAIIAATGPRRRPGE